LNDWRPILAAALREHDLDELARETVEASAATSETVRESPELMELARRGAAANLALVAAVSSGELSLREAELPPHAAAYARELARRNIPVSELARGYRIGQRAMWRFGMAELRTRIDDTQALATMIESYTDATFATGEVLMGLALERYGLERERWIRSAGAVRRAMLEEILADRVTDADLASRRLGFELRRTHVGFVVWGDVDDAVLEETAAAVGGPHSLVVAIGAGVVAGWCVPAALETGQADTGGVAYGLPGSGLSGFRQTHLEALEARRVARLGAMKVPAYYQQLALAALLTHDLAQANAFASRELGELSRPRRSQLADTLLEVLLAQGSPRHAAKRMHLHENTVAKRVRAAEDLLGRPATDRPAETLAALLILRASRPCGPATPDGA
jgi:hypothetical protein